MTTITSKATMFAAALALVFALTLATVPFSQAQSFDVSAISQGWGCGQGGHGGHGGYGGHGGHRGW